MLAVLLLHASLLAAQAAGSPSTAEERYLADLRARIARGDVDAEVALGNLYESGQSVLPLDPEEAARWYRSAADKGHAGAQMNLAMMHLDGFGVARDVVQAVAWYQKAARSGDAMARFSLGAIYEAGAAGVARDEVKAAEWYRQAAGQGLAIAQYRLGVMYRDGRGVGRDRESAIGWLRTAADQDNADAQLDLGILLSERSPADAAEAHAWLNLAASRWKDEAKRVQAAALRDRLEETMTPAQRRDAYRRAADWQDAHAWPR
jgi:TPR repeat protein